MKYFSTLLKFIFTLVTSFFFILSFFFMIPCYVVVFKFWKKEKAPVAAHRLTQLWAQIVFIVFFVRYKIRNREFIDQNKTYIFISNHRSQMDIPLCVAACKNTFRFLAKAELIKVPLLGYMIKNLYITVSRSNKADRSRSMEVMKNSLDEHISVFLYPEGTRNKTKEPLINFHDGAFRLAIKTQRPLAILTITDSDKVLPPVGLPLVFPGFIHADWSMPIETTGMTEDDLPMLKEKARDLMVKALTKK